MDTIAKLSFVALVVIFVIHALSLNFTQDDAFISYRYVRNFVNGEGLVFNSGERVEGYTNFLWIVILILVAKLGFDIVLVSKVLGVASGCLTFLLLYLLAGLVFKTDVSAKDLRKSDSFGRWFLMLSPCLLLVSNSSFAYWSVSGLETVFFAMAVFLSVYLYIKDERFVVPVCAVASLIRPEGVLVFVLILAHRFFFERRSLTGCVRWALGFVLLLLPFVIFRFLYYGDLLPNPFYAKTGVSFEYLRAGVDYLWLFLKHYGLWGLLYCAPLVAVRWMSSRGRFIVLLLYVYTLYIVLVGGDVLRVHRFFVPLLPFLYLLFSLSLAKLQLFGGNRRADWTVRVSVVVGFCLLTFFLPREWILRVRRHEIGLCGSMSNEARAMTRAFGDDLVVAMTTIGAFSYASQMKVIDMLGLTDPYIAKNPEEIEGITSRWKERNFNTQYLLSLDPDVIIFSTGLKPSAPAEKALFLSSKFRENYYPYYLPSGQIAFVVYKRKGIYSKENEIFTDPGFVNMLTEAENLGVSGDYEASLKKFQEVLAAAPEDWGRAHEFMAACYLQLGRRDEARHHLQRAVELDDYSVWAHWALFRMHLEDGDTTMALQARQKIERYNPEMLFYLE